MVQIVPRRPDLDAPANATEHMAIPDKLWASFAFRYPMSRYGKSILPGWKILSATLANFQDGLGHADIRIGNGKPL